MNNENGSGNQNESDTLMARIMEFYRSEDYTNTQRLLEQYVDRFGLDRRISILRDRLEAEFTRGNPSGVNESNEEKPGKDIGGYQVVSAFDELEQSSDSWEMKPADIQADIAAGMAMNPPPTSADEEEDVMELSNPIAVSSIDQPLETVESPPALELEREYSETSTPDVPPTASMEIPDESLAVEFNSPSPQPPPEAKKKDDTRPFDISEHLIYPTPETPVAPPPEVPQESEVLSNMYQEMNGMSDFQPGHFPGNEDPETIPQDENRIPPADKEFVAMLEEELSKNKKKSDFGPSFMKNPKVRAGAGPSGSPARDGIDPADLVKSPYLNGGSSDKSFRTRLHSSPSSNRKPLLLILLGVVGVAAIGFTLFKSGVFGSPETDEPVEETQPVRPNRRDAAATQAAAPGNQAAAESGQKAEPKPAKPMTPRQQLEAYLQEAEQFYANAEFMKAKQTLWNAKKIANDLRIMTLESKIDEAIMEQQLQQNLSAKKPTDEEVDQQAFEEAKGEDTQEAYRSYLEKHPGGIFSQEAQSRLRELQRQERLAPALEVEKKARGLKELNLRIDFAYLTLEQIGESWKNTIYRNFKSEEITLSGKKIWIDYTAGLMWTMFERPLNLKHVNLQTSRRFANLSNWRLPSTEEVKSLMQLQKKHSLPVPGTGLQIWTGDRDADPSEGVRNWLVMIPQENLISAKEDELHHLFLVRTI